MKKRLLSYVFGAILVLTGLLIIFLYLIYIPTPSVDGEQQLTYQRKTIAKDHYEVGSNWLRKNKEGIWECYVEGSAYERGQALGLLNEELLAYQENVFVNSINEIIPSESWLHFLKYAVAWQNRKLPKYISEEYQKEILGMSIYASDQYDYIGPKYQRKLMYHAAHDIGHTVQNMGLVGCSAFSVWGEKSTSGEILSGRNFDFSIGDGFRKNKLLLIVKPDTGLSFCSYTWPGMIGVLSGLNEKGLSISINAGPPTTPASSKTPVTILAREILQYAENIEEAFAIASEREIFVAQSFLISSKKDGKSVVIEKTADKTMIYESGESQIICTNHFQSPELSQISENTDFIVESSTDERFERLEYLLEEKDSIGPTTAVTILRDQGNESDGRAIAYGNEGNINALIAHHSIVFLPESLDFWISTGLAPLDKFLHYNLNSLLSKDYLSFSVNEKQDQTIQASDWLQTVAFENFSAYKKKYQEIITGIENRKAYSEKDFLTLADLNPADYKSYLLAAQYYEEHSDCSLAAKYAKLALTKQIPWLRESMKAQEYIQSCKN